MTQKERQETVREEKNRARKSFSLLLNFKRRRASRRGALA
jgi:hypothetical protein